jgi:hypothetical protein
MADITKCSGANCPVKDKCYRYTSPASLRQSYFWDTPGKIESKQFSCDMYFGENAQSIWKELNIITNTK